MAKRNTKQDRDAAGKAALEQRLRDIAWGAYGDYEAPEWDGDQSTGLASEMGVDAFGRFVGAIGKVFCDDSRGYLVNLRNLEHFDSFDAAVEHLWNGGVRP